MLYALLFLPAAAAVVYVLVRARRPVTIAEEAAEPANVFETLEALLAELERATLDEREAAELEALADELEEAAKRLEGVG